MPFMHSENLDDQQLCVKLFTTLEDKKSLQYAIAHCQIIERFQRFPHRNKILGRVSTAAEQDFLANDAMSSF